MAPPDLPPLRNIGISIYESPEMRFFGFTDGHLKDARAGFAIHLLASGANLAYGGDLRDDGLHPADLRPRVALPALQRESAACGQLLGLACPCDHEDRGRSGARRRAARLCPAGPCRAGWTHEVLRKPSGRAVRRDGRRQVVRRPDSHARTHARPNGRSDSAGRQVGGLHGHYARRCRGSAARHQAKQPVFLVGGFGGCARDIAETLEIAQRWAGLRNTWEGRKLFDGYAGNDLTA